MKKVSFYFTPVSVFCLFFLLAVISCNTPPSAPDDETPYRNTGTGGNDVWALLQRGDSSARGLFLGEVDANAVDPQGRTPLHYAAERGDTQLASFFISIGANVNALDNSGQSPLGISIGKDDSAMAAILTAAGADIHLPISGTTAARLALTKNGAMLKAVLTPASAESVDSSGKTIIHIASIEGNLQAIENILSVFPSNPALLNKIDNDKRNALDYALLRPDSARHMEIAEQLILSGAASSNPIFSYFAPAVRSANFNIRRNESFAPIHYAVRDNYPGMLSFLFSKNVDVNIKNDSGATPLHEAARAGNLAFMRLLLDRGANVNAIDGKGNTPLHTGIPANVHREAANLLLERGADPNLRDEHGDTPLHIVIILNRSIDVAQTLLGGGSDVHIRNIQGKTPLYVAIQEKRNDLVPLLLSYGSDVFATDNSGITPFDLALRDTGNIFSILVTPETVTQRDSAGNTMLHIAVNNNGSPRHIGTILDQRPIIDARNRDGDTALHIAVRKNQRENGEYLITRGSNIFAVNAAGISSLYLALTAPDGIREWMINPTTIIAKDGLGNNMLHFAAQWKLDRAIPVIIQKGVPIDEQNATGETALFMAVKTDSISTIRVLLENKANLNARDKQGNTLLHTAVRWNSRASAALLISSGIDINAYSLNGCTALHDAVSLGMSDIETLLIAQGANLEVRDIDGNTPFMDAVKAGLIPSIQKLASYGADTATRNNRGDTPLHIAVIQERYDLVSMLLNTGASIHARNTASRTPFQTAVNMSLRMVSALLTSDRINLSDNMGNSALHIALQERASPEIIRLIIIIGSRINAVDNNGQTPLRLAVDLGLLEQAKILADEGADPFFVAVDNKSPADIAISKGVNYVRALFSGRAINSRDSSANTVLHFAARYGTPEIIETLLELGANKTIRNIASELPVDIALRWNRIDNAELLK
jgi:ankyrin repeat protein